MKKLIVIAILAMVAGCGGTAGRDGYNGIDGEDGYNGIDGEDGLRATKSVFCEGQSDHWTEPTLLHVEWTDFSDGSRFIKCFVAFGSLVDGSTGITMSNSNFRAADSDWSVMNQCRIPLDGPDTSRYIDFEFWGYGDYGVYVYTYFYGVERVDLECVEEI